VLGALGLLVAMFQVVVVGLPEQGAGAAMFVRFGLVVAGAGLLGTASLTAALRGPRRPDQPPPRSVG
jgi:hypothetical protein